MPHAHPILAAGGLVKRFPGVTALRGVSFSLEPGEIHAICGENGAGKSTLIKILSGLHPHGSFDGTIQMDGEEVAFQSITCAETAGVAVICQELAIVPGMSVAENIFLGREPVKRGLLDWNQMNKEAFKWLGQFHLKVDPTRPAGTLGIGQQQLVEIIRALRKNSRVLILDEPTSALTSVETKILHDALLSLKKRGISCVYISHKMEEVFAIADRITVIRDGESIATLRRNETTEADVIRHMVGREINDYYPKRTTKQGEILLSVKNLSAAAHHGGPHLFENMSFDVRAGEVLGIGGLMGSGRTELVMHLFGAAGVRTSGTVELDGLKLGRLSPGDSIRRGIVLVSEDRKRFGLVLGQTVGFNLSLASLRGFSRGGLLRRRRETKTNASLMQSLRIKAPHLDTVVGGLSGGNQQKVVLGRALMSRPRVILLDEPTRGIDVAARVEVYELVNRLAENGHAVILVSSEMPELMGMSDRIIMLCEGRLGGTFVPRKVNQETLLRAAMGQHA